MGVLDSRFSCVAAEMQRLSLDFSQAVKNMMGYGSVWYLQPQAGVR